METGCQIKVSFIYNGIVLMVVWSTTLVIRISFIQITWWCKGLQYTLTKHVHQTIDWITGTLTTFSLIKKTYNDYLWMAVHFT